MLKPKSSIKIFSEDIKKLRGEKWWKFEQYQTMT